MFDSTALELAALIKAKKLSVIEVVNAYIGKIEDNDKQINAFLTVAKEKALERAKKVQEQIDKGETVSPLAGVPVALKDNISTIGIETNCASKMLEGYNPVFNATVTDRLESAGMIIVGKLNMDEFAMGGSSETGVSGAVHNPWDTSRVAGGSSGGCAAAVAAKEIPLTLGSDSGGSIRQPCSFCGVTGIKPTYGSVSRYGAVAYASSLDQIGPIGQNIDDCAAMLSVISGQDEWDSTCVLKEPFDFDRGKDSGSKKIKIGLPKNYFESGLASCLPGHLTAGGHTGLDEDVKLAVLAAAKEFEKAGAIIEEFEMPLVEYTVPTYYVIGCAEASSNLSRFDGLKYGYRSGKAKTLSNVYRFSRSEGFGLEVKRRIMLGSFVLSSGYYDAYYKKALQVRSLIKDAYTNLFRKFDIIISPVSSTTAFEIGENINDPVKMYIGDIYTAPVNLAGLPSIALPCGFDKQGLPVGFQITGSTFSEPQLVNIARVYQSRTDYHTRRPS